MCSTSVSVSRVNQFSQGQCHLQEAILEVTPTAFPVLNCKHFFSQFSWPLPYAKTFVLHVLPYIISS